MTAPANIGKIMRLRARDGDQCWLCGEPIDFNAKPNTEKAWSMEHLLSKAHGGSGKLENLVLCHPPCNFKLASLPLVEKVEIREKLRREAWLAALQSQLMKVLRA